MANGKQKHSNIPKADISKFYLRKMKYCKHRGFLLRKFNCNHITPFLISLLFPSLYGQGNTWTDTSLGRPVHTIKSFLESSLLIEVH